MVELLGIFFPFSIYFSVCNNHVYVVCKSKSKRVGEKNMRSKNNTGILFVQLICCIGHWQRCLCSNM